MTAKTTFIQSQITRNLQSFKFYNKLDKIVFKSLCSFKVTNMVLITLESLKCDLFNFLKYRKCVNLKPINHFTEEASRRRILFRELVQGNI